MPRSPLCNKAQVPKTSSTGHSFSQRWILKLEAGPLNPRRGKTCLENISHQKSSHSKYQVIFTLLLEKRPPPPPFHLYTWKWIEQELRPLNLNSPVREASSLQHPLTQSARGAPGQGWSNCRSRQGEAGAGPLIQEQFRSLFYAGDQC